MITFGELLDSRVREAELYEKLEDGKVVCFACGHRCRIFPGKRGICKVRYNSGGTLMAPWGYVGGLAVDPIEKKPFFHAYPGSRAASFGMLGCDFHCGYCQNWVTSQSLRDPDAISEARAITPQQFVNVALSHGAKVVTSTYNEPLITSEWAVELFRAARAEGLIGSFVSNGNATREALEYIRPFVDLYKIDLKSFQDSQYRKLGGVLANVLEGIRMVHDMGFWLEVVTLVVPGFNDSDAELADIAGFISSVSPDIPWHVTAFHSDYKMGGTPSTPVETLVRAAETGKRQGLRYVYAGNLPGRLGDWENTRCPSCGGLLVERSGFAVISNRMTSCACPDCGERIVGRWA